MSESIVSIVYCLYSRVEVFIGLLHCQVGANPFFVKYSFKDVLTDMSLSGERQSRRSNINNDIGEQPSYSI